MPRPRSTKPARKFLVSLPENEAIELEAFCRTFLQAPRAEIARQALRAYIRHQLDRAPAFHQDFLAHVDQLTPKSPLHLVEKDESQQG